MHIVNNFKMNKKLLIYIGIGISLLAVFFSLKGLDWKAIPSILEQINLVPLIAWIPTFYLIFILRALRWQMLLPTCSFKQAFDATMLGFFASSVLPLRAGEFIRPWIFSKWSSVPVFTSFASVVVERVFDVLALMVMLSASLSLVNLPPDLSFIVTGAKALLFIALVISFVMLIAYLRPRWIESALGICCDLVLGQRFSHLTDKIKIFTSEFIQGLKVINSVMAFLKVVILSLLLWLSMAAYNQITMFAFDGGAPLLLGLTVTSFVALAVAAPSAPGFIGTFQFGCLLALKDVFGYSKELAISYAVIVHLSQFLLILMHGFYILNKEGLKLSELSNDN